MAIEKAEKNKGDEAVQRKNKVKTSVEVIIVDDDDDDCCSDLQTKGEVKKKKDLVKRKGSYQKGTKKKKKRKKDSDIKSKAYGNLPIVTESSSDSEYLTKNGEMSKILKKKGAQRLPCEGDDICEVLSKELAREQQGAVFFRRQSGKRKTPDSHGDCGECIKKMKKKKKKDKLTRSLILHSEDCESQKQIIPNVVTISQDTGLSGRKKRWILDKDDVSNTVKKKKLLEYLTAMENTEESSDGSSDKGIAKPVYQLQEENHCKRRTLGGKACQNFVAQVSEEETRVIRKKGKKKKPQKERAKTQENNSGVSNENLLKPKSRETRVFQEEKIDLIPDTEEAGRVTKKKTIHTKVVSTHMAFQEDNEDASAVEKRKKKVKKYKAIQECTVSGNSGRWEKSGKLHIKKKRKNKDRGSVDNCEEEPSLKKGRLKKETKEREDEIKIVAFKKGNCDEITIDKSRRQALQEEIDRESGKTKVSKKERELESHFGQWSTATFESSERKAKFLRLLGGFKKGSSVSAQDPPGHATKRNMALDWNREQNLQRDLQAEFEKAVGQKHHRGIGLGFQPAPQKQMHIDKYASKSIKFED